MVRGFDVERWLPLVALAGLALLFEPVRANFVFADQGCEWPGSRSQWIGSVLNVKHVIAFGCATIAAAHAARGRHLALVAGTVLAFSALIEFEQSVLETGHCRLWDLVPNVLGIMIGVALFAPMSNWRYARRP